MNGLDSPAVLWLLVAMQFIGVLSAFVARVSEGTSHQAFSQGMFLGSLTLMGVATLIALAIGPGCWLACCTALAIMILMVTCDFRNCRESSTW
jgi:hypothetical protein